MSVDAASSRSVEQSCAGWSDNTTEWLWILVPPRSLQDLYDAMCAGYNEAGLKVTTWRQDGAPIRSSWGARLGQGAGPRTLWVEAVKDGNGCDHGG